MTKQRIKDIQAQLQREVEMTTRQATLIKQLYTERDSLIRQLKVLRTENKLLSAQHIEWQNVAFKLMIALTNARADLIVQSETKGG